MGDITRVAKENLEAPRVIKVYNAEDYQNRQFEAVNEHNRRSTHAADTDEGLSNPVVQMVTSSARRSSCPSPFPMRSTAVCRWAI